METQTPPIDAFRGRDSASESAPDLDEYRLAHPVSRLWPQGPYDLKRDCTRLILYNVQSFTVAQIWTELRASLGELARTIVKVNRVTGPNRNPHADLWVLNRDSSSTLVAVIRQQTKSRLWQFSRVVTEAERLGRVTFPSQARQGDELRKPAVTQWRVALWQPWRERRNMPALETPPTVQKPLHTVFASWNVNGFWSKKAQIVDFLMKEKVAILAMQETLVKATNYPVFVHGYSCYQVAAEEGFRGTAVLVDKRYASYEVPHGLRWLTHVKVFGYAGLSGPTHLLGVYLSSGGNHRTTRREAFITIAGVVNKILRSDPDSRVIVLGDLNCTGQVVQKTLQRVNCDALDLSHVRGSALSRFPVHGKPRDLDHVLFSRKAVQVFRGVRVYRDYNASDHRPVVGRPRVELPSTTPKEQPRVKYDNKMIRLKSDLVANDNAWTRLMTRAFGEDYVPAEDPVRDREVGGAIAENTTAFIKTFDRVCRKHSVKKEIQPMSKRVFPRNLKQLLQTVKRYSAKVAKATKRNRIPEESDVTRLARAQRRFKTAKREWEIRMKQKHYASVADDFMAHDHKGVWNRLNSQVKPMSAFTGLSPVKDKEGVVRYRPDEILDVMRQHYEDLLTYDPDGLSRNFAHWEELDFGDPLPPLEGVNDRLGWPEILITIRGLNRNTAPGQDGIHVNVLKAMVLEESMAQLETNNPRFNRPDNVRVDLPASELPTTPLTSLGKAFHALLLGVWQTAIIPPVWQTVEIVNLFKGGDPENTTNYRGISLISCAYKVLMAVMASRLSDACVEAGVLAPEQAGFRKREEAVAQAIALAEITRRRWMKGKPTYGLFVDFKKAYDRLYHGLLFRTLSHIGVRGRFLNLVKSMYMETKCVVRMGNLTSDAFSPVRGAKQGDPLSPILFIIAINSVLTASSSTGGVRAMPIAERCPGLLYADDVIALESRLNSLQETLRGIWDWGQKYGMELGRDKCGVIFWPSNKPRQLRDRTALDYESDCSSIVGKDDWGGYTMDDIEYQHNQNIYATPDGEIPTVMQYKYLGITVDSRLGDPRKIVTGERSMELAFAFLQAKKGMNILHSLRPFLTDRFCPIAVKVMMVRNLVYSKMLYGAEFIGFQALHAEPLQRVINLAAKWILGISGSNTQTDAFTLCFELGLPPVHQEMCAMRARLCFKLDAHTEGGLNTWIQSLWDQPPLVSQSGAQSWVTGSRKWLKKLEEGRFKYKRVFAEEAGSEGGTPPDNLSAPLRPWAQLGKSFELKVRSNAFSSDPTGIQSQIRTAFLGETQFGEMAVDSAEAPMVHPVHGFFEGVDFDFDVERDRMDQGRPVPSGRDRGQVVKAAFVRDVVLERMMSSQKTKGFLFYDQFHFGMTRGFLREAVTRPDLSEGVRWLSLVRTRGFPTVEGAWQRIRRSGRQPQFERGKCPLCSDFISLGWEWAHLLTKCTREEVAISREKHLGPNIRYLIQHVTARGGRAFVDILNDAGMERQTALSGVLSIYLAGGLIRPPGSLHQEGWFDSYHLGFGHLRIVTPSLERFSYVPVAQFLQSVSPLYLVSLGGDLYGDRSLDGSLSASSRDESVNQDRQHEGGGSDLGDAFNAPGRDPSEPLTQLAS